MYPILVYSIGLKSNKPKITIQDESVNSSGFSSNASSLADGSLLHEKVHQRSVTQDLDTIEETKESAYTNASNRDSKSQR